MAERQGGALSTEICRRPPIPCKMSQRLLLYQAMPAEGIFSTPLGPSPGTAERQCLFHHQMASDTNCL